MEIKEMVEKFQCPGCLLGYSTECGRYKFDYNQVKCSSHKLGTMVQGQGHVALGLPKGFCRPGWDGNGTKNTIDIRLWKEGTNPGWDALNIATWAMEYDGFLLVRTFSPRINYSWVDVIENGTISMVPNAINVADFHSNID